MYTVYKQDIFNLAKSILIKDNQFAKYIEDYILPKKVDFGLPIDVPKNEWKYYLNISGNYHPTDTEMFITSLDTLSSIPFNKDMLKIHKSTLKGYLTEEKYVKELLERYPENRLLINGILNPIDIQTALDAPEYSILQYDARYVEQQEYSLIDDLQEEIQNTCKNWYNKEYNILDRNYFLAYYEMMMSLITLFIMQIRERNELTHQVHSYFLWAYLETKAGLGKYQKYLDFYQAHWLYRNITYVLSNLGKQEVMDSLIEVLLTHRNISIGRYTLDHDTELMDTGLSLSPTAIAVKHPVNLKQTTGKEVIHRTIDYVIKNQIPLAKSNGDDIQSRVNDTQTKLNGYFQTPLKLYEVSAFQDSKNSIYTLEDTLLSSWIYYSVNNIYLSRFFIKNAKTGSTINVDAKEAFILYCYLNSKKYGYELKEFFDFRVSNVIRPNMDTNIKTPLIRNVVNPKMIETYFYMYPHVTSYISSESFRDDVVNHHRFLLSATRLIEMSNGNDERGGMQALFEQTTLTGDVWLSVNGYSNVENWILSNNWDFEDMTESDIDITLTDIVDKVLANSDGLIDNSIIQEKLSALLNELTSFNIQIMSTNSFRDMRNAQTPTVLIGNVQNDEQLLGFLNIHSSKDVGKVKTSIDLSIDIPVINVQGKIKTHGPQSVDLELTVSSRNVTGRRPFVNLL